MFISYQADPLALSLSQVQTRTEQPLSSSCLHPPNLGLLMGFGVPCSLGLSFLGPQVSALRRLAKPMSERVAGRAGLKPPMLDSGAEVSASTTSSEAESGARSVSSIVRQWNRKINHFLGDHPAATVNGTRPARWGGRAAPRSVRPGWVEMWRQDQREASSGEVAQ